MATENPIDLSSYLKNGLSPFEDLPYSAQYLLECGNLYPITTGLRGIREMEREGDLPGISQVFYTRDSVLICRPGSISVKGEGVVTLRNPVTGAPVSLVGTGQWRFCEFKGIPFLSNGMEFVWRGDQWYAVPRAISAMCAWRGRLILGGFLSEWSEGKWSGTVTWFENEGYTPKGMDEDWVWWSTIGGGDLFHPYIPEVATKGMDFEGEYDASDPYWVDLARRNESNGMPAPFGGKVLALSPMRDSVVVLGERGVGYLRLMEDPARNLGFTDLHIGSGLRSPSAWASTERRTVWVDGSSCLWSMGVEMVPERLGYSHHLKSLISPVRIYVDSGEDEWYITDGYKTFVLTSQGLGKLSIGVWGMARRGGTLHAHYTETSPVSQISLETLPMTLGFNDLKEIRGIEVGAEGVTQESFSIRTRSRRGAPYLTVGPFFKGPEGFTLTRVRGIHFSVKYKGMKEHDPRVYELRIRYIPTSQRSGRGPRSTALGNRTSEEDA